MVRFGSTLSQKVGVSKGYSGYRHQVQIVTIVDRVGSWKPRSCHEPRTEKLKNWLPLAPGKLVRGAKLNWFQPG